MACLLPQWLLWQCSMLPLPPQECRQQLGRPGPASCKCRRRRSSPCRARPPAAHRRPQHRHRRVRSSHQSQQRACLCLCRMRSACDRATAALHPLAPPSSSSRSRHSSRPALPSSPLAHLRPLLEQRLHRRLRSRSSSRRTLRRRRQCQLRSSPMRPSLCAAFQPLSPWSSWWPPSPRWGQLHVVFGCSLHAAAAMHPLACSPSRPMQMQCLLPMPRMPLMPPCLSRHTPAVRPAAAQRCHSEDSEGA